MGLASLAAAIAMVVYRPAFTDLSVVLVLWFASPGALCLGGLVLWAYRREDGADPGVRAQRVQSIIGMCMALVSAAIVYLLIIFSVKLEPIEPAAGATYNPTVETVLVARIDTRERRPPHPMFRGWGTKPTSMKITLNGESSTVEDGSTVADLLRSLDLAPVRVAVEVNEDLVPRTTFADATLRDGDRIEVVTFVGGG